MSFNRNKDEDRARTLDVLAGQSGHSDGNCNWLGHRLDADTSKIDDLLLRGATKNELDAVRGAIAEHFYHLEIEHGLLIARENGKFFLRVP